MPPLQQHANTLLTLPQDILEHIAFEAATQERFESPKDFINLLLTCRTLNDALAVKHTPTLYARLFEWKFDTAALRRRFQAVDARKLADEYTARVACLGRFKRCTQSETLEWSCDKATQSKDLWRAYFMAIESDYKNMEQLRQHGNINDFLEIYTKNSLLTLAPQYPRETVEHSLVMHLMYFATSKDTLDAESASEADQRFYMLKSYVFAAHEYPAQIAPWNIKLLPKPKSAFATRLPVPGTGLNGQPPETVPVPFLDHDFGELDGPQAPLNSARNRPVDRSTSVQYMGLSLSLAPPLLFLGACLAFELRIDRDPEISGSNATNQLAELIRTYEQSDGSTTLLTADGIPVTAAAIRSMRNLAASIARAPKTPFPPLDSVSHDFDFQRLQACANPFNTDAGLTVADLRGKFQGTYEGRFFFFDFQSYREMLSGSRQSLFTGAFRAQPQVWQIEEVLVQVCDEDEQAEVKDMLHEGGSGPVLNAGFEPSHSAPIPDALLSDLGDSPAPENSFDSPTSRLAERTLNIRAQTAAGRVLSPKAKLDPTKRYEILLSGKGHSAWGSFILKGRVRTWDGLFSLAKEYTPDGRGRWLYRGYALANSRSLVGRWRDTFTPEDSNGYEGTFAMTRRK